MDLASTFYAARLRSSAVILQDQAFEREAIMDWQPPARPRPFHAHEHKPAIRFHRDCSPGIVCPRDADIHAVKLRNELRLRLDLQGGSC
jgi:hypothetical protein